MSNLIKRDKAIDYFVTNIGIVDADGYAVDDYDERVKIWTERFSGIPSAEPERKWIPVSEKLPNPWVEVLTTYEYKGKRFVQTAEYAGQNDENGHPLFCAYSDEFAPDHYDFVYVAWMPLPEPWRGK